MLDGDWSSDVCSSDLIFDMTMVLPFASVPVSSGLAAFQFFVAMIRIQKALKAAEAERGEA
jgi:TRAP-type C4-dicarboxylate transport system permease small subunit